MPPSRWLAWLRDRVASRQTVQLEREMDELARSACIPPLAGAGLHELATPSVRAAAQTRLGTFRSHAATTHLVYSDTRDCLSLAVCEGNYKSPITVVAGWIVAIELSRRASFTQALRCAHDRIFQLGVSGARLRRKFPCSVGPPVDSLKGMGTSFAALRVHRKRVELSSLGECCIYRHRQGELTRITTPDTMRNSPEQREAMRAHTLDLGVVEMMLDVPTKALGTSEHSEIHVQTKARQPGDAYFSSTAGFDAASAAWASQVEAGASIAEQCRAALAADAEHQRVAASCAVALLEDPRT